MSTVNISLPVCLKVLKAVNDLIIFRDTLVLFFSQGLEEYDDLCEELKNLQLEMEKFYARNKISDDADWVLEMHIDRLKELASDLSLTLEHLTERLPSGQVLRRLHDGYVKCTSNVMMPMVIILDDLYHVYSKD